MIISESPDFRLYFLPEDSSAVQAVHELLSLTLFQLQENLNYYTSRPVDVFFLQDTEYAPYDFSPYPNKHIEGKAMFNPKPIRIQLSLDLKSLKYSFGSQLAAFLVEDMLYGTSLNDKIKTANLVDLPNWVLPGLYHYLGENWSIYDDNEWRMVYETHGFENLNAIPDNYYTVKGASFWNYISRTYGSTAVSSLVYTLRHTRKINTALVYAFQKKANELYLGWSIYYTAMYEQDQNRMSPLQGVVLNPSRVKAIAVVKDSLFFTFQKSNFGFHIYRYSGSDLTKQKIYGVINSGTEHLVEKTFSASTSHVVWLTSNGVFYQYHSLHVSSGLVSKQKLNLPFTISQAKLTPRSNYFLCASWDSSFMYNYAFNATKIAAIDGYITSFDAKDNALVFIVQRNNRFEIWHQSTNMPLRQIYFSDFVLTDVLFANDSTVLLNAGLDGILNGKVLNIYTGKLGRVTNYRYNIAAHQYNENIFAEYIHKGEISELFITEYLPVEKFYLYDTIYPTAAQLLARQGMAKDNKIKYTDTYPDSLLNYSFQSPVRPRQNYTTLHIDSFILASSDIKKQEIWSDIHQLSLAEAYIRLINGGNRRDESKFIETIELQTPNKVNIDMGITFADKQNKRSLSLGASGLIQRKAIDIYATYTKDHKWARQIQLLYRRRLSVVSKESEQYSVSRVNFSYAKPVINKRFTLSHSYALRYDQNSSLISTPESLKGIDSEQESLLVSQVSTLQFYHATRKNSIKGSLGFGPSYNLADQGYNFTTDFSASLFTKLSSQLSFKSRGRLLNSFGTSPHFFMIGGFDSDLQTSYYARQYAAYKPAMLYHSLFGVRGFALNYRNGNTAMYGNAQLDWNFLKSIIHKPIGLAFLDNLTLRSFIDVGTSFYGRNIFDQANVLNQNTVVTETGSIIIQVNAFKNPFIGSAGLGVGSKIYGYLVSLDVAVGYESQDVLQPMVHLNFGHDF